MDGNGGIVGVRNTGQSGRWGAKDVFFDRNGIRLFDITDGLVNRWKLTENGNDLIGGLTLTNNGSVTFSSDGASFNGSSQWLSCTRTRPSSFSISVWVTPVNFSIRRAIILGAGASSGENPWGLSAAGASDLAAYIGNNDLTVSGELTTSHYPAGIKTLVVMTYDGSTIRAYRGASSIGAKAATGGTGDTNLSIGRFGAYGGHYWYGTIADARLYSRALTANDIAVLADNGPNP